MGIAGKQNGYRWKNHRRCFLITIVTFQICEKPPSGINSCNNTMRGFMSCSKVSVTLDCKVVRGFLPDLKSDHNIAIGGGRKLERRQWSVA
ncbi:hypothetical protein Hanom_Chr14g01278581 [Helianthus anomalus]